MRPAIVWMLCVMALGCGGAQTQDNAEPAATEAPATADNGASEQGEAPVTEAHLGRVQDEKPEGEAPQSAGRMAFTQCDPAQRPEVCTKEYRPVCGVVDTGVRCITQPCDSTEQRNFGNACMACADDKTNGYWPVACEDLGNDAR